MTAMLKNFALAAKRIRDGRRDHSDPGGSAEVFMHDQPYRPERRRRFRPDADEIGADIAETAGEFSNADAIGGGLQLDERIVTAKRNSCAFQRLIHLKRT